jgi:cysteine-rich repeat protein
MLRLALEPSGCAMGMNRGLRVSIPDDQERGEDEGVILCPVPFRLTVMSREVLLLRTYEFDFCTGESGWPRQVQSQARRSQMRKYLHSPAVALLVCFLFLSCADADDDSGSSTTGDSSGEVCGDGIITASETCDDADNTLGDGCDDLCEVESGWNCTGEPSACDPPVFTHKMLKRTGENLFAALAYECQQCTFAQWLAIDVPTGWRRGPAQYVAFSSGVLRSRPSFTGVPDAVDFTDEVPGDEYELIAKNLSGQLVAGFSIVQTMVQRDTLLGFDAGRRVHELTRPDGGVFVLFAHEVDPENVVIPDFQDPGLLDGFIPPAGWSYASRVLEQEMLLETDDIAAVLAIRGWPSSPDTTWELR